MPIVPLFGRGVKGRSSNVSAQRRVNLYCEQAADNDKSDAVLYSRPGLYPEYFAASGAGYGAGPFRGVIVVQKVMDEGLSTQRVVDIVFGAMENDAVASVENANTFNATADVFQTSSGPVSFADNGKTVLAVDGRGVYVANYDAGTYTLSDVSATLVNFPLGATSICCIAGRFVANDPSNKGRFWFSAPLDYTSWDGLDYATAESFPDALAAVYAWRGELLLFGTYSLEFWAPTDDGFVRTGGSGAEWGVVAQETIRDVDGQLFFLARNSGSDAKVVALSGYQAQPVSEPDVEYEINANLTSMSAQVIRKAGHTFYLLSSPTRTWAFNASSGDWGEWQTNGGRFAGKHTFFAYGRQSVTDYQSATIYGVDANAYVDGTSDMLRELDTRHLFHDLDRLTLWELRLDIEPGVGLITGQGSDPQIMLQVSRDGGHTFGDEMWEPFGKVGEYGTQVVWRRLGRARDMVFRFRVADPVKTVFLGASVRVE